jgi:hypothetical protein
MKKIRVDLRAFAPEEIVTREKVYAQLDEESAEQLKEYDRLVALGPGGRTDAETTRLQALALHIDIG